MGRYRSRNRGAIVRSRIDGSGADRALRGVDVTLLPRSRTPTLIGRERASQESLSGRLPYLLRCPQSPLLRSVAAVESAIQRITEVIISPHLVDKHHLYRPNLR